MEFEYGAAIGPRSGLAPPPIGGVKPRHPANTGCSSAYRDAEAGVINSAACPTSDVQCQAVRANPLRAQAHSSENDSAVGQEATPEIGEVNRVEGLFPLPNLKPRGAHLREAWVATANVELWAARPLDQVAHLQGTLHSSPGGRHEREPLGPFDIQTATGSWNSIFLPSTLECSKNLDSQAPLRARQAAHKVFSRDRLCPRGTCLITRRSPEIRP